MNMNDAPLAVLKVRLRTTKKELLNILYTKLLGSAHHIKTDAETQITEYKVKFKDIPHVISIFNDYAQIAAEQYSDEQLAEIVSVELLSQTDISELASLFSTPLDTCNQVMNLGEQVKIIGDKLDASKAMFFDYNQFHRLPEVLFEICKAINRDDIMQDFSDDVVHRTTMENFRVKH